jgi:hypothetical protein
MSCISSCLHLDISEDLKDQAMIDTKKIKDQKGFNNPTTIELNKDNDYIGSLAQNGFFQYINAIGYKLDETTPFFDNKLHKDDYDFKHRGATYDIKGSPMQSGWQEVKPSSQFLIKNDSEGKKVWYYYFVKVDLENDILHFAGIIPYEQVWRDDNQFESKYPCRYIKGKELKPFRL